MRNFVKAHRLEVKITNNYIEPWDLTLPGNDERDRRN